MPAVCHFCATLSFQKIKETAKEEHSYANTTLAFAVPPRKIQKGAKQIKGDNGLLITTYTSTCQEHTKLSSCLSIAAAMDHLLNPGAAIEKHPCHPQPNSTHPHQHPHPTSVALCSQIDLSQTTVAVPAGCSSQWRWWPGMQSLCYTFLVFTWSLLTPGLLSCPTAWCEQGHQEGVLGANPTWRNTVMALSVKLNTI